MLHRVRSRTLTAVALVAVSTLTALASSADPSAHAASLAALRTPSSTATYINPTHTYQVSYPATWSSTRHPATGVDLLVMAPDGTVGAAVFEFTCRHNWVYIVADLIRDLQAPTLTRDEGQLHAILVSLTVA